MSTPEFFHQCHAKEYPRFRNVFAAVVPDQLDWKPEPKARSARELMGHLIGHNEDLIELARDGVIHHRNQVPFDTIPDALDRYQRSQKDLEARLPDLSAQAWGKPAAFMAGDHVIMTAPTGDLMWLLFLDSIHHRGQLCTYLRPMGSKVPSIYGPSADDPGPGH